MLNDTSSHGLWEKTAPPAPKTGPLAETLSCEVAIVGGGYTGLSAALTLAEAGVDTVLLEAAEIGHGGSGRNVGLVNAGLWMMPDAIPEALGERYGERLLALLGAAPGVVFDLIEKHAIDCEPVRAGTLHCAADTGGLRQLEERARQWRARGAPVHLLDARAAAARTGTEAYAGALLDERAGTIQPLGYARGLATAALAAGARLYTHSRVTGAEGDAGGWQLSTASGSVRARRVIVATNAYTRTPWPQLRSEIIHLPFFNFATAPLPAEADRAILPQRQGAWDTRKILTAFRRDRQGRLIVGSVGSLAGAGMAVHRAWARRTLARLFPELGDVAFEAAWYGLIGMTADHLPKLHRPAPGVIGFSGYNGRGIGPGTVFGRALADHLTGALSEDDLPLPVSEARAQPLRGLREQFYRTGAQVAHLWQRRV